jgi:hypothetical protein
MAVKQKKEKNIFSSIRKPDKFSEGIKKDKS